MEPKLASWSWGSIQRVYEVLGAQLKDYQGIANRFGLELPVDLKPGALLPMADDKAEFVARWYLGVNRINMHIVALDDEIARRNKLIGVFG